ARVPARRHRRRPRRPRDPSPSPAQACNAKLSGIARLPPLFTPGSGEDIRKFDKDAKRFYAIARGSALECAAIIDAFAVLQIAAPDALMKHQQLLDRTVAMLTVLIRN